MPRVARLLRAIIRKAPRRIPPSNNSPITIGTTIIAISVGVNPSLITAACNKINKHICKSNLTLHTEHNDHDVDEVFSQYEKTYTQKKHRKMLEVLGNIHTMMILLMKMG